MLHLFEFVWTQRSAVLVVFNNFLLIDATDKSKFSSDQKRFFIALSLYPFHFSRKLPLNYVLLQEWSKTYEGMCVRAHKLEQAIG